MRVVAVGSVALALLAAGCSNAPVAPAESSFILKVNSGEPQHLLPTATSESEGSLVLNALFDPLIDYDASNKPVESAAESITSSDNKVWTIKLKAGRTFHNGEAVTSDSFIDSWNYGAYGPNGQDNNYFFEKFVGYGDMQPGADPDKDGPLKAPDPKSKTLTGLKKVDDTTFTATLEAPFADFKMMLGYTAFYPLPKAAFSSPGVISESFEDAPIGNGPFKMKGKWEHDAKIEVERWADFKGTKPKVAGVEFKIYSQLDAAYSDLVGGNLDVLDTIPTTALGSAATDLGERYQHSPSSTFQYLAFPVKNPKYAKPEIRKAISMALDRDEMIKAIFKNTQRSADAFVSPVVNGYRPGACGATCKFDATAAKKLYTDNGGSPEISITYNADGGHKEWVDAACNQLQNNLGVKCVGIGEPKFADVLTKLKSGEDIGFFRLGWVMDYPSMENYLGPLYSTGGSSNYYGYSNPAFDALVKAGNEAKTPEEALKNYQAAEDILVKDVPVLPMRFGQNNFGFSDKVKNVKFDLFSRVDLVDIEPVA
jgi:peptide/nickel transport system substrate-binding protein/oligopeptide transport system substrate-binding protein